MTFLHNFGSLRCPQPKYAFFLMHKLMPLAFICIKDLINLTSILSCYVSFFNVSFFPVFLCNSCFPTMGVFLYMLVCGSSGLVGAHLSLVLLESLLCLFILWFSQRNLFMYFLFVFCFSESLFLPGDNYLPVVIITSFFLSVFSYLWQDQSGFRHPHPGIVAYLSIHFSLN
jgi:hypothetical protein